MEALSPSDKLQQKNEDFKILTEIIQTVHKSSNLEEVYNVALGSVMELENVDLAMIYLIDEEKCEAVLKAHINVTEDYIRRAGRIPYPKGITWKAINSGRIINIEDAQKDPDTGPVGRELGHHSNLGIPIFLEQRAIGVIWFGSYKERRFNEREVDLLSALGHQIAIAIAKAKMIEEIKEREEALRSGEERYRAIVEDQTELICRFLPDGTITFVNESYCRYFAKRREELIGRCFVPFIPDEDQERCKSHIASLSWENPVAAIEHRVLMPNGVVRWQQWTDRALFGWEGNIVGFQSVGRDITERKRAEDELERSLSLLHATLDSTADGILVVDREGKITSFNRNFVEMWHIPDSIIASRENNRALAYVLDQLKNRDSFLEKVRELSSQLDLESCGIIEFKDGRTLERYSKPQRIGEEIVGRVHSFRDITERKKAEEALRESERRFQAFMDNSSAVAWMKDEQGRYVYLNKMFEHVFNVQQADWLGKTDFEIWPEDLAKQYREHDLAVLTEKRTLQFYETSLNPDGRLHHWLVFKFPFRDSSGLHFTGGVAFDITDLKQAEEDLRSNIVQLSKKNRYETIISTVIRGVHQSINLQDVLENAVEAMHQNIDGVDNVSIYLVEWGDLDELSRAEAVLKAYRGYPDWFIERARRIPYPKGFTWRAIIEGNARYCPDIDQDTAIGPAGREMGTKSYASMPMHYEGKTVGVININSLQKNAFDEEELKLLQVVAQQIVSAISNAQIMDSLRQSEERFRRIFEEGQLGMAIIGLDNRFNRVNAKLCKMLGYTEQELTALTFPEVTHSDDINIDINLAQQRLRGEIYDYRAEKRYIKKNKEVIWCNLTSTVICDKEGKPLYSIKMVEDITERKRGEMALQDYSERLQSLSHKLLKLQETERRYIARELHDEIGQVLTAVKINLQAMQGLDNSHLFEQRLEDSISIVDRALTQVRSLSLNLRPSMLDDLGLGTTLRWYVDRQAERAGFVVELVVDLQTQLHPDLETVCFRIAQEALTNTERHARAKRVYVELRQRKNLLELIIRDNGIGFDVRAAQGGTLRGASFGLLGMQERAQLTGGQIEIKSRPGHGTTIRARLPLITSSSRKRRR